MLFLFPTAHAATAYPVYSFIFATPNPAGLNQDVLVSAFTDRYPPSNASNRYTIYVDFVFTVTVTDPTGIVTTKRLLADPVGGSYFMLNPNKIGTWTLKMHFEGTGPIPQSSNNSYLASDSNTISLVVQEQPATSFSGAPLPTGYWQRPIYGENREWGQIAGSWLGMNALRDSGASTWDGVTAYNPWSKAPTSAHIIWTKPLKDGGIVGYPYGAEGFYTGDSYERIDKPAIIMDGVFYRNIPRINDATGNGFEAIDLRTGETLWTVPNGTITFGQLLMFDSLNQHGVIPYLWNNNNQIFDARTGNCVVVWNNTVSGSRCTDDIGSVLQYIYNYPQKTLAMWNSTRGLQYGNPVVNITGSGLGASNPDYWRPSYGLQGSNANYNFLKGIMWNVTIPDLTSYGVTGSPSISMLDIYDDVVICRFSGTANDTYPVGYNVFIGYSMVDGRQLWVKQYTNQAQVETGPLAGASVGVGPGYFFYYKQETLQWHAYSATTGEIAWTTEPYESPWATYYTTLSVPPAYAAYGHLYTIAYDGMLHCYDLATGNNLWNALGYSSGTETPYGSWPTSYMAIADGKVYVSNGEHSPNQPLYRGYELYCVDANTGDLIWKVSNYGQAPIIADGYLLTFNGYDMQNYAFGKGLSAVTVSAPQVAVPVGTGVLITGTVSDQSPGQTCLGIPAAGTPAISDDSMSAWMEYLYMQYTQPANATGVSVFLQAMKSDGTVFDIGRTTSDIMGHYEYAWTPETADTYKVLATFEGSNSYYASSDQCGLLVGPAVTPLTAEEVSSQVISQLPTQAPYPTAPSASDVADIVVSQLPPQDNTLLYAVIAVVVITLLMCIVNLALLTKKK